MKGDGIQVSGVRGVLFAYARRLSLNDFSAFDHDILNWDILMPTFVAGASFFDFVDDVRAFDYLAEYAVAPALWGGGGVVQKVVVRGVDEKLSRGRVRVGGACHRDGVEVIF